MDTIRYSNNWRSTTTLHQVGIFRDVAQHLNFTRAAQELHLSQPSASMQIQQLEEELGAPLFEKVGKRVNLSEAGKVLEGYVPRVMALLEIGVFSAGTSHGRCYSP